MATPVWSQDGGIAARNALSDGELRPVNEVLGVSMAGPNAGEVIHEAAMALRFHAKLHDFIDLLHVCPTMAEALKIVTISRYKDPAKLSCCAE
jgi:mercuric reductase